MKTLRQSLRASLGIWLMLTLLLGIIYPLAVMAVGEAFFSHRVEGGLVERGGKVVGARLLAQNFTSPKYFWERLSATTPPYNAAASAGSNLSPANGRLLQVANERIAALQKADPTNKAPIPVDLITASASGLDPHISPAAAEYQVMRVAKARNMKPEDVHAFVQKFTEKATIGIIGEPRVNVLLLNLALDEKK